MRSLSQEVVQVKAENVELARDVTQLRAERARSAGQSGGRGAHRAGKLGLVRKSEVVFQFGKAR